ncbi:response regulator [Dongia sedimenti]|uniref:Response regulator n=1 Tax=Dongia sedimenti TaxID=3064282 RepID=A0ABU0YJH2_9PROT|nr:response regulator [Rhodospirillaceae bacterium R-7]
MASALRETVYIVDDDDSVRDSARALLESYDLIVEDFESARAFLASFDAGSRCCLVLDVNMPEMSGLELLELLRGRQIGIPVIIVTAQKDDAVQERAQRAGVFAFFEKPVDESIIEAIAQALKAA